MLFNIRGTSGSGKSTAVRELIERLGADSEPVVIEGRKQPLYTVHHSNGLTFATLGHYNTACGGCDTLSGLDKVFDLYKQIKFSVDFVIAEGKILGDDFKRTLALKNEVKIFYLTTSIEDCYAGVKARRIAAGQLEKAEQKPKKLEPDNRTIASATRRLEEQGVKVFRVTRGEIVDTMIREMGI